MCRGESQQVYSRLTERLGMTDHLMVLNAMLGKIAVNLKVYGPVEDLIQQTLSLFQVTQPLPSHSKYPRGCHYVPACLVASR